MLKSNSVSRQFIAGPNAGEISHPNLSAIPVQTRDAAVDCWRLDIPPLMPPHSSCLVAMSAFAAFIQVSQ